MEATPKLVFCFILCFCAALSITQSTETAKGCSASPLTSDGRPFAIVWNHPTFVCQKKGYHLDFERWGIIDNQNDEFRGEKIALYYHDKIGKWPYIDEKTKKDINGGIPQLSNITEHVAQIGKDLDKTLDKSFNGLGVLDFENWRPLYKMNFYTKRVYQKKSLDLVKRKFPTYTPTQRLEEATKEFNQAAKEFFTQSLAKVKKERPNGKWGYYLFPRCFDKNCNGKTYEFNDRIGWLFETSSGLFPSAYFHHRNTSALRKANIEHTLGEAFRVKAKYSAQDVPVMLYSETQEGAYRMYTKEELDLSIKLPAEMGASGVVLWGFWSDVIAPSACPLLKLYLDTKLGPYCLKLNHFFGNCSQRLCHGKGRCVRVDYERTYQQHLRDSGRSECLVPSQQLGGPNKTRTFPRYDVTHGHKTVSRPSDKTLTFESKLRGSMLESSSVDKGSIQPDQTWSSSIHDSQDRERSNGGLGYDFDDYYCKCYPGFSGKRCQEQN